MPKDVLKKMYELNFKKEEKYSERTQINSEIKYLEGQLKNNEFSVEEIEKYSKESSAEIITEKLQKAAKINSNIDMCDEVVNTTDKQNAFSLSKISNLEHQIREIQNQIEAEKKVIKDRGEKLQKAKEYLSKVKRIDTKALNDEFDQVSTHNKKVEQVRQLQKQQLELSTKKKQSDKLSETLKEIDNQKKELFKSGNLPVPGLEFDDETITYDGLPLNEEQIPTSKLINIGLKIGMAMNPNLKLLVIRDGSLLDEDTTKEILEICDHHNYQLLIEVVDKRDVSEPDIEFIEK
jgi:hypothetical protein